MQLGHRWMPSLTTLPERSTFSHFVNIVPAAPDRLHSNLDVCELWTFDDFVEMNGANSTKGNT